MYKLKANLWDNNGHLIVMQLVSIKWRVLLREKDRHIHVTVTGPNGYRKQGLSNVKSDLSQFELKVAAFHFYRLARDHDTRVHRSSWIEYVNYAEIFGSCFD